MVFKIPNSYDEFKEAVVVGFDDDSELFDKYHVINGDKNGAILDTLERIEDIERYLPMEKYILLNSGVVIGFTCLSKEKNALYSFGINIHHRNKEKVLSWFNKVKSILSKEFTCILNKKNTRAIDFMLRNGMKQTKSNMDYLKFNLCQQED